MSEVLIVMVNLAGEGMTMVVVTHEMGFAREVVDKVVETGHQNQFFAHPAHERIKKFQEQIL